MAQGLPSAHPWRGVEHPRAGVGRGWHCGSSGTAADGLAAHILVGGRCVHGDSISSPVSLVHVRYRMAAHAQRRRSLQIDRSTGSAESAPCMTDRACDVVTLQAVGCAVLYSGGSNGVGEWKVDNAVLNVKNGKWTTLY